MQVGLLTVGLISSRDFCISIEDEFFLQHKLKAIISLSIIASVRSQILLTYCKYDMWVEITNLCERRSQNYLNAVSLNIVDWHKDNFIFRSFWVIDQIFLNEWKNFSQFSHNVWKYGLVNSEWPI